MAAGDEPPPYSGRTRLPHNCGKTQPRTRKLTMNKRQRRHLILGLVALMLALVPGTAFAAVDIEFGTDPPAEEVIPEHGPVISTIRVVDNGQPVANAVVEVSVTNPTVSPLFSTDMPMVEGKPLGRLVLAAPEGEATFNWLWPIRGDYSVVITARPAEGSTAFEPVTKEFTYHVDENPAKRNNLIILLVILIGFGLLSGFVLGRSSVRVGGQA